MSDSRNIGLRGSDEPKLRLADDQQVVDARVARPRRVRRRRGPIERGMLDRGRNAERLVHELSNLLDGSLRNVGLALRRLEDDAAALDLSAAEQLRTADHALRYMAELLDGWRAAGREPAAATGLRNAETALGEVIHEATRLTRPTCEAAGIALTVSVAREVIDEPLGQLYPVILNGLRNAVESVGRDGAVELAAEQQGRTIEIRIADTGRGVSPDLPRDGDGLIAAGASTKGAGHGLGLAISRDIVRALGGVMRLEDRPDDRPGAVLLIRLPVGEDILEA